MNDSDQHPAPPPSDPASATPSTSVTPAAPTAPKTPATSTMVAADVAPEIQAPVTDATAASPSTSPQATGALLGEHFPALFGPGIMKPIKLRIQADIQQRAPGVLSRKALSVFLHRHTTSTAYLKGLVAAETRFDLDGQPAGEIAAEHREAAAAELARRLEIVRARRAAERGRAGGGRPVRREAMLDASGPAVQDPSAARGDADSDHRRGARPKDAGRAGRGHATRRSPQVRGDRHAQPVPGPASRYQGDEPGPSPSVPVDVDERERALLLRAWETSTLTKANFCVLRRLSVDDFDARIAQAQMERRQRR